MKVLAYVTIKKHSQGGHFSGTFRSCAETQRRLPAGRQVASVLYCNNGFQPVVSKNCLQPGSFVKAGMMARLTHTVLYTGPGPVLQNKNRADGSDTDK